MANAQLGRANDISAKVGEVDFTHTGRRLHRFNSDDICRIQNDPCGFPVDAEVVHDKNGQMIRKTQFFVGIANGTKALGDEERQKYLAGRWGIG